MWSGEDEFKPLLERALLKPSKSSLAAVTQIAVRDEKWVRDRAYTSWPPCVLTPSNGVVACRLYTRSACPSP